MRGATCSSFLANSMASATADIELDDNACQIADDDVLIISDCRFAHVFTANDVNPDPTGSNQSTPVTVAHSKSGNKNNSDNLTLYTARAQVAKFENITYFIGTGASGEPALWQIRDGTARELVDGVEDLQIWFGQDGNGDFSADRYLKASDGAFDMGQAISMRMHLLLRTSSDNVTADPQQYIFDGAVTDVLTVMRGATCSSFLANSMGSATADISLADNACQIADDDVLIISDCRFAHVFTANDVNPDPTGSNQSTPVTVAHSKSGNKNNSDNLTLYTARAQVAKFENITYFIGTGASGEPALWQIRDGTARELVDGVEDLQIWFGQDGNGDFSADRYLKASDGAFDMGQAISMRMHLLLRTSSDNVTADPQQYIFDGATVTATDNRLRREFKTMVNLRNKSLWYPSP